MQIPNDDVFFHIEDRATTERNLLASLFAIYQNPTWWKGLRAIDCVLRLRVSAGSDSVDFLNMHVYPKGYFRERSVAITFVAPARRPMRPHDDPLLQAAFGFGHH